MWPLALCTVTFGFPNSKKNSFRRYYIKKYGIFLPYRLHLSCMHIFDTPLWNIKNIFFKFQEGVFDWFSNHIFLGEIVLVIFLHLILNDEITLHLLNCKSKMDFKIYENSVKQNFTLIKLLKMKFTTRFKYSVSTIICTMCEIISKEQYVSPNI